MINLVLGLLEAAALFVIIIVLAGLIGKTAGKFFDNDPR
jgi:hypothetical protein